VPRIGPGLVEVYCHPATGTTPSAPPAAAELAALLSPVVRAALDHAGIRRMSFAAAASAS